MNTHKTNVLIVDPSQTVTCVLSTLFGEHGFEAHVAQAGWEALQIMECVPVDSLCFAYELGDMAGIELFMTAQSHKLLGHQMGIMVSSDLRKQVIGWEQDAGKMEDFQKRHSGRQNSGNSAASMGHHMDRCPDGATVMLHYRQILERFGMKVDVSGVCAASESLCRKSMIPILALSSFNDTAHIAAA